MRPDRPGIRRLFHWLDTRDDFAIPDGEVSIAFLDDPAMADLHGRFLGDPTPTDVITFPGDPEEELAGEICVGVETARARCLEEGTTFAQETTLYLVHGWLHLAGLRDKTPDERRRMRAAEARLLGELPDLAKPSPAIERD